MKLVIGLGGNALLRRGEPMTDANQLGNIRRAAAQLARVAPSNELVLTHGNGPQVGLLALQAAAYRADESTALDVLGAQSDGMIGYLLEQEMVNLLPGARAVVTLLTRVEVDREDPAFEHPTKPIGPVYSAAEGVRVAALWHWTMAADGAGLRRVVASPQPLRVCGLDAVRWLLARGAVVIAAGGGGIPVARGTDGRTLHGVDAVIDKDLCTGMMARELGADLLVIATDVDAVYLDWGQPGQHAVGRVTPDALARHAFPDGSMGPKVRAACDFVRATGHRAAIGSLDRIVGLLDGSAGTQVCMDGASMT